MFVTSSLTSSLEFTSESLEFTRGVTGSLESGISSSVSGGMLVAKEFGDGAVLSASTDATRSISSFNTTITGSFAPIKTDLTQSKGEVFTLQSESTSSRFSLNSSIVRLTQSLDASSSFAGKFITSASILRDNLGGVESSASFLASGAIVSASTDATSSILVLNTLTSASIATSASFVSASAVIKAQNITDEGIAPIKTDVTQSINASASFATSHSLVRLSLTSSKEESDLVAKDFGAKAVLSASAFSQGAEASASAEFVTSASILKDNFGEATQSALTFAINANLSASAQTASLLSASSSLSLSSASLSDASASLALASASMATQVSLEDDGLEILNNSSTLLAKYGSKTELFAGGNTSNKAILDTGGLAVVQGGVTRSFFGSSITIGKTTGNNTSRVEIASDAVNIINRDSGGTESTVLSFDKTGDVVSDNFLLERTRLFGAGGDGDIILLSNSASVATGSGAEGSGISENTSEIFNEQGTRVCTRTGSVWSLEGDLYANNLTLDDATGTDITLITSGSRIFVKNELSIHGGCVISNNGQNGDNGDDSNTDANTRSSTTPTLGGKGGFGRALATGSAGRPGSRSGIPQSGTTRYGGNGGGGGGSGGIVFISARFIVNSGSITANGGNGGDGGNGGTAAPGAGGTGASDGVAGSAGSVINIKV